MPDRNPCKEDCLTPPSGTSRGFSLLEMLVTIAIAAILLGYAMPSFRTIVGESEITATVNEFVFSLQTARSEAIKRAGPVALCHSATPLAANAACDGSSYADGWIVYVDRDDSGTLNANDVLVLQTEARSAAFTFTPSAALTAQIRFSDTGTSVNVTGLPLSGSVVIDHASGSDSRSVNIGASGRVSLEEITS